MIIYLLRHEERYPSNPLFFSKLTENGLKRANNLVNYLDTLNIDSIYCSPFLRVIQTIYPYCIKYDKFVNIDNSLYESMDSELFNESNSTHTWLDLPVEYKTIINKEYKSTIETVKLHEIFEKVCIRVKSLLEKLKSHQSSKSILIVTHLTVCNAILNNIDPSILDTNYIEMGQIVKIEI